MCAKLLVVINFRCYYFVVGGGKYIGPGSNNKVIDVPMNYDEYNTSSSSSSSSSRVGGGGLSLPAEALPSVENELRRDLDAITIDHGMASH